MSIFNKENIYVKIRNFSKTEYCFLNDLGRYDIKCNEMEPIISFYNKNNNKQ